MPVANHTRIGSVTKMSRSRENRIGVWPVLAGVQASKSAMLRFPGKVDTLNLLPGWLSVCARS
jgi:hypothetical protein